MLMRVGCGQVRLDCVGDYALFLVWISIRLFITWKAGCFVVIGDDARESRRRCASIRT